MDERKKLEFTLEEFANILHTHADIYVGYKGLDLEVAKAKKTLEESENKLKELDNKLLELMKEITKR